MQSKRQCWNALSGWRRCWKPWNQNEPLLTLRVRSLREVRLTEWEDRMAVTVVWDTWLKPGAEAEGLRLTRQVWSDMRTFEGYISHELLVDQDAPGHIIALGRWRSRA